MSDDYALDQPVELTIRGDRIDVLGWVISMHLVFNDEESAVEDVMADRGGHLTQDLLDGIRSMENFGAYEKALKRAQRNGDVPDFRGTAVEYREFDPQHPEPAGPKVDNLPDLETVDRYAVMVYREEEGFQAAGWPEHFEDIVEALAFASFIRGYARDIENATEPDDPEAAMEAMGE